MLLLYALMKSQAYKLFHVQLVMFSVEMEKLYEQSKVPTEEMIELAKEHGLVLMRSPLRAYEASGVLYYAGLGREGADV